LRQLKALTKEYVFADSFRVAGNLMVSGVPVIDTTAITVDNFLIGDFARGAASLERSGIEVTFWDQNSNKCSS